MVVMQVVVEDAGESIGFHCEFIGPICPGIIVSTEESLLDNLQREVEKTENQPLVSVVAGDFTRKWNK